MVHLTLGSLRKSQAVSYALSFFQLDGFAVPAPAQVTQTVLPPLSGKGNQVAKIRKRGKTVTIKFENKRESSCFLRAVGFNNIPALQDGQAVEHTLAHGQAFESCPECKCVGGYHLPDCSHRVNTPAGKA